MSFVGNAQELRDLCGEEGFRSLVAHYGGNRFYVPMPGSRSDVARRFGIQFGEHAGALQAEYGGNWLRIPKRPGPACVEVPRLEAKGVDLGEIARRLRLSPTTAARFALNRHGS